MTKEYYKLSAKITRLANRGARRAQEKARRAGVPVVYAIDGCLYKSLDGRLYKIRSKKK